MSREIVRDHGVMLLLGSMRAEERLAAFLLNLVQRLHSRGFSQSELVLRMTREEIGSYLGMKLETVSRTFSKFVEEGADRGQAALCPDQGHRGAAPAGQSALGRLSRVSRKGCQERVRWLRTPGITCRPGPAARRHGCAP